MVLKEAFPLLVVSLVTLSAFVSCAEQSLGEFIKHYEPLNYDTKAVHAAHKHAVSMGFDYEMQFDAFGHQHKLRVRKDDSIFTPDAVIQDGDGNPIKLDHSSFITGEVVGEPGSKVHGVVEDGAFRGKIIGREGNFYIEPAKRYIDDPEFHSVMYREGDVKYDANYADITKRLPRLSERQRRETDSKERVPRASESEMKNNVCKLGLFADDRFTARFGGRAQAASKIVEHVQAVQRIYMDDFNKTDLYAPYGLTFRVKQITVYDSSNVPDIYKPDNLGIDPMLDLLSKTNHDDVCEAFLFTDRDFDGGILGLAWIGSTTSLGGVCSKFQQGRSKSYNTGIVTTKLYGRFTPPKVSEVTFAHELGHGFGSQHDPDGDCTPGGAAGNYIMYSKATSGDRTNNDLFSPCSVKAISKNVNAKRSSSYYKTCFSSGNEPICGNRIIEGAEQCDCGDELSCKGEGNCCNPAGSPNECKLRVSSDCSLSQGPCCNKQCKYAPNKVCRNATTCIEEAKCADNSKSCPALVVKDAKATCSDGRKVCGAKGDCLESICAKYNLEECQCTAESELCDICCKNKGKDQQCIAAKNRGDLPNNLAAVKKVSGSPCANFHGYCDVFAVCRRVDMSGPLKRLSERFLTVKGLKETVKKYWWAILLGILVGIILIAVMVHVCVRYTPSSNPLREAKRPAKKLPKRKKKNQDRTQDAGRNSPTLEMEHEV